MSYGVGIGGNITVSRFNIDFALPVVSNTAVFDYRGVTREGWDTRASIQVQPQNSDESIGFGLIFDSYGESEGFFVVRVGSLNIYVSNMSTDTERNALISTGSNVYFGFGGGVTIQNDPASTLEYFRNTRGRRWIR